MALLAGIIIIFLNSGYAYRVFQNQDQRTVNAYRIYLVKTLLTEFCKTYWSVLSKKCLQNIAKIILATEFCKTICPLLKKNIVIFGLNSAEEFCRTILHK